MGRSVAFASKEAEAGKYILVVDDEFDIRWALQEILEGEGYATVGASNGVEALDQLREHRGLPRLILLDLMMPEMDGWTFLSRIDEDPTLHRVPVALMSAHASVRRALDKHRDEKRPMRLLFPKPLNLLRLLATARHFWSGDETPLDRPAVARGPTLDDDEPPTTKFRPLRS